MKNDIKEHIMHISARLFSENGFHATSIRDIAKEANCSLSMVYYYFQNKDDLYYELAYSEFIKLNQKIDEEIASISHLETRFLSILNKRLSLTGYDRYIYRLALKTYYCFNQDHPLFLKLKQFQEERYLKTQLSFSNVNQDHQKYLSISLSRVIENIITKAILLDYPTNEEEVFHEIKQFFK